MTHRIRAGYVLVLLAAFGAGRNSRAEDVPSALFACAKLGDALERVTCYDRLTQRVRADLAARSQPSPALSPSAANSPSTNAPASGHSASTPSPGTAAAQPSASSASPADMFGARPAEVPAAEIARTELKSLTAHVTAMHGNPNSGTILELDNGQRWQQLGREDLLIDVGQKVVISRGAFSSFWIVSEANRSAHVKRLL